MQFVNVTVPLFLEYWRRFSVGPNIRRFIDHSEISQNSCTRDKRTSPPPPDIIVRTVKTFVSQFSGFNTREIRCVRSRFRSEFRGVENKVKRIVRRALDVGRRNFKLD